MNRGINLNDRERDILPLSVQGYIMKEIADILCLSVETNKFHKRKLFEKMGVKNIIEAMEFAENQKLF